MYSFNINIRLSSGCILTGTEVLFGYPLAVFSEIEDCYLEREVEWKRARRNYLLPFYLFFFLKKKIKYWDDMYSIT